MHRRPVLQEFEEELAECDGVSGPVPLEFFGVAAEGRPPLPALHVHGRALFLQAGQDRRVLGLENVDAHYDVGVGRECAAISLVDLAPLGPMLHDEDELPQARVDERVRPQ